MIDKVIHSHLDKVDALEVEVDEAIDKIILTIDIDAILESPANEINRVVDDIRELILDEYADKAVEFGIKFAQTVEQLNRDIKIPDSKDPNLNKDIME